MSVPPNLPLKIRIITTFLSWMVAFAIIYSILFLFGPVLANLHVAVRALIISGILVTIMGNFVMPWISKFVSKNFSSKK